MCNKFSVVTCSMINFQGSPTFIKIGNCLNVFGKCFIILFYMICVSSIIIMMYSLEEGLSNVALPSLYFICQENTCKTNQVAVVCMLPVASNISKQQPVTQSKAAIRVFILMLNPSQFFTIGIT